MANKRSQLNYKTVLFTIVLLCLALLLVFAPFGAFAETPSQSQDTTRLEGDNVTAPPAVYGTGSVTITSAVGGFGTMSYTITISGAAQTATHALAVQLLDGSGAPVDFPAGATATLNGATPVRMVGGYVFFDKVSNGPNMPLAFDMRVASIAASHNYKISVALCETPSAPAYPMGDAGVAVTSAAITVGQYQTGAMKVDLTSEERVVDKSLLAGSSFQITVQSLGSINGQQIRAVVKRMNANGVFETTSLVCGWIASNTEMGITKSDFEITGLGSAEEGTYCVEFTYGTQFYRIEFTVVAKGYTSSTEAFNEFFSNDWGKSDGLFS